MSIRTRLSLFIGALVTGVVVVTGAALFWADRAALLAKAEKLRAGQLAHLVQTCRDAMVLNDALAALNVVQGLARSPEVSEAYCVDPVGQVFTHTDVRRVGTRDAGGPAAEPGTLRAAQAILLRSGSEGRAVILYSKNVVDRDREQALRDSARRIAGVTLAALGVGVLGALVLAQGLIRPILRIAEGTRKIAQGELDHRVALGRKDELGRLAEDFNAMALRLGELDRMKNDFTANVTHELRSPLSAIESYANLMIDNIRTHRQNDTLDYLAIVRNNAIRLGKFINDLLDVAKIEARRLELSKAPVSILPFFQELLDLFGPKAREKNIQLTQEGVPENLVLSVDADKMIQVFTNLIGNALKFTPSGGQVTLTGRAGVTTLEEPLLPLGVPHAALAVTDTGPGIPPADAQRIFRRFEQVRDARDQVAGQKGTGLGLSIAQGIVEAHGGIIALKSEVGRGSSFVVYLPEVP